ncbi:MAG: hypothetical protein ACOVSW_09690 [Candidatus Kapaibacteriota bacterium]|jgi:hypothetical protein
MTVLFAFKVESRFKNIGLHWAMPYLLDSVLGSCQSKEERVETLRWLYWELLEEQKKIAQEDSAIFWKRWKEAKEQNPSLNFVEWDTEHHFDDYPMPVTSYEFTGKGLEEIEGTYSWNKHKKERYSCLSNVEDKLRLLVQGVELDIKIIGQCLVKLREELQKELPAESDQLPYNSFWRFTHKYAHMNKTKLADIAAKCFNLNNSTLRPYLSGSYEEAAIHEFYPFVKRKLYEFDLSI